MAFWDRRNQGTEDWDDRDRVNEYEKNYRAYADEYENAGWEAPEEIGSGGEGYEEEDYEEEGYGEEQSELYSEEELIPEEGDYPEEAGGRASYDAEVYDDYAADPEYDDYPAEEDLPEGDAYYEDPELSNGEDYPEEENPEDYEGAEIPVAGSVTEQMFQGEIRYVDPEMMDRYGSQEGAGEYDAAGDPGEYEDPGEYADPEEYYDETYEEGYDEETVDYDSPVYAKASRPSDDDDDDDRPGFLGMGLMEKVMLGLGFVAVILVVVVGAVFINSRKQTTGGDDASALPAVVVNDELSGVGSALDGITFIGEKGLLAALDARKAALAAASVEEEITEPVTTEYEEADLNVTATVSMEGISVLKDLKIKFTNSSTKKLIANVPFTLTVTDPSGKTISWTDDDQDGIIYHKNLTEGTYTIHVEALKGEKYAKYSLPADKKVEVKGEIKYEEVEVADEVLDASQVNEAAEDTARDGAGEETEAAVTDTVAFVESTETPTYEEILKTSIPNPLTVANLGSFRRLAATQTSGQTATVSDNTVGTITLSAATLAVPKGGTGTLTATLKDSTGQLTVTSSDTTVATAALSGSTITVTGVKEGKATLTVKSTDTKVVAKTCEVTVTAGGTMTLSASTLKTYNGVNNTFTVTLKDLTESSLSVKSSDENIAKAVISGTTVTVTGVAEGSATITVSSTENPDAAQTCTVKVANTGALLKDTVDGKERQYYVFENNEYRKATYADYFNANITKFYVVGEIKYTGWQTLDGATYYYTADGKVVTGSQVIQGVRYEFGSDGKLVTGNGILGIDVSKWNGTIDWNKVKSAGVNFVIIRVGYRGSTQGALIDDSKFASNIKGATAAGLKVGVYFFTQAIDEVEAVYEASMVLDRISGYKISYPVYLDVESSGGRGDAIDKTTRTAVIKAFCATVAGKGYPAGVYANKTWLTNKIDTSQLGAYKIWLAQYATEVTYTGRYEMWQYSSKGSINGISGNVDLNLSYMSY